MLLALAVPPSVSAAERPRFLALVRGSTYEFRDDAANAVVSIPVSLSAGARVNRIRATVLSVSLGQREDLGLVDAFTATPVRATRLRGPRLNLTIKTAPGLEPGTYNVIVDVRRTGRVGRSQRRRQRLELLLVHVPARLRAPPTIVVERTGGFLFLHESTDARPLRLDETSRKTQLTGIEVNQIDGPTGAKVTSGELTFAKLASIPPKGHAAVEPTPDGDFPLGSSTGTLQVDAPQLEGPVTVAFEMRNALHWMWLVLVIAVGVFAGWLVRHVLAGVIARNQARQNGYALLDSIAVEHERRRDEGFRGNLTGVRSELESALQREREPSKIDAAVEGARTEVKSAVSKLDQDRDLAQSGLTALTTTIRTRWTAPKPLSAALGQQGEKLDEAGRLLDAYDVGGARQILRESRAAIESVLREQVPPWETEVRNFLVTLDEARLPSPVRDEVKVARTEIEAALASTSIDRPQLDLDTVMEGVHAAETRLRRLLTESLGRTALPVTAVLDELAGVVGNDARNAVLAAERSLEEALRGSEPGLAVIAERAPKLAAALRTAIEGPVPDSDRTTLARISTKLDAGRYVEAARLAAQAAVKSGKDRVLGGEAAGAAATADAELPAFGLGSGFASPAMPALVVQASVALRDSAFDLTRARAASRAALADATVLRAIIVGIGVVLVGCGLFLPSFTGTFEQFLAAFLWGFAADVTSEGLYQLAKSSGSPASTAPADSTTQA